MKAENKKRSEVSGQQKGISILCPLTARRCTLIKQRKLRLSGSDFGFCPKKGKFVLLL